MDTKKKELKAAYNAAYRAAHKEKASAYMAAWRSANPGRQAAYAKAWLAANREKVLARQAAYRAANPGIMKASTARWRAANPGKVRASAAARRSERYRTDPNFRIAMTIRSHLKRIVKSGGVKDATSLSYVGCTVARLRKHLERQFKPGMTWGNHGEWHIDHITPLAAFDFAAFPAQIKQAEHYTNLRPMWARDNLSKSDTLLRPVQLDLIAV